MVCKQIDFLNEKILDRPNRPVYLVFKFQSVSCDPKDRFYEVLSSTCLNLSCDRGDFHRFPEVFPCLHKSS